MENVNKQNVQCHLDFDINYTKNIIKLPILIIYVIYFQMNYLDE